MRDDPPPVLDYAVPRPHRPIWERVAIAFFIVVAAGNFALLVAFFIYLAYVITHLMWL